MHLPGKFLARQLRPAHLQWARRRVILSMPLAVAARLILVLQTWQRHLPPTKAKTPLHISPRQSRWYALCPQFLFAFELKVLFASIQHVLMNMIAVIFDMQHRRSSAICLSTASTPLFLGFVPLACVCFCAGCVDESRQGRVALLVAALPVARWLRAQRT